MLIGTDKCLNYKAKDFEEQLEKATGGETDIYFDNVAGHMLDSMLVKMKQGGVVVACGGISAYNSGDPTILKRVSASPNKRQDAKSRRLDEHRLHAIVCPGIHRDRLHA